MKYFEDDLAKLTLKVASAHLATNGQPHGFLDDALGDWDFQVRYAEPKPDITSQDRRDQEKYLLDVGLVSRVDLAMGYFDLSRDEAVELLKRVDEDEEMLGPPPPDLAPLPAAGTPEPPVETAEPAQDPDKPQDQRTET